MFRGRGIFKSSQFLHKRIPFRLADIGEGISEVQIIQWHVKEGAPVKQFEKIADVQSDKATVEITSRYDGIVKKLHYAVNDMAKVGEPLLDIETDEKSSTDLSEKTKETNKSQVGEEKKVNNDENDFFMMPSVRKYIHDNNIDLKKLKMLPGRVRKEDILNALNKTEFSNIFTEYKMNPVQKAMSRTMEESLKIPHFGYSDEYRMDNLVKVRQEYNEKSNLNISMMSFVIKAIEIALKDFPKLNAHYVDGKLIFSSVINLGIAIDTPQGLVVPVMKDVARLETIEVIAEQMADLTDRSRRNKLRKDDFEGGTLTVSNIGTIGGTYASPVIVPPQVCIVAIGKMRTNAVFNENGAIEPQKLACFSWSADHRVIDGATMARFSNRVKELIENPSNLLV
jgi:2-oxoisovalerate dehydrogenase E2 component (dihydrolipoyl transacylase)